MANLSAFLMCRDASIRSVIECIDRNTKGIAIVVDDERRVFGTVTDGDIRRAILAGIDLSQPVEALFQARNAPYRTPISVRLGTSTAELLGVMNLWSIRHVPIVDEANRVVDVAFLGDLVKEYESPIRAVVMAGGYGTRLRPLTTEVPKPMLPVGDKPLLERIIRQLAEAGIRRVNVTTHYRSDVIANYFGNGKEFGSEIQYVKEDAPLGTAGALSLLDPSNEPLLVINGDIVTRLDFKAMVQFHRDHAGDMTIAVCEYEVSVPYGVVEIDDVMVRRIEEKPRIHRFINAGIYLLSSDVCRSIPAGRPSDMPDLIRRLIDDGRRVLAFPVREYWRDIGGMQDYERAVGDVQKGLA